jgi:hypothetical protein
MPLALSKRRPFATRLRFGVAVLALLAAGCAGGSDNASQSTGDQPTTDPGGPLPPASETAVIALDNEYVQVARNSIACPDPTPTCRERVIVALDTVLVQKVGGDSLKLGRGDFAVFSATESYYNPTGGRYYEVAIKPNHPPVESPPGEMIPPGKNIFRYIGDEFFIFEEQLNVGDTRDRHSHSQRVVMQMNATKLRQWPDGQPELVKDIVPDSVGFNAPVVHKVFNMGPAPLRGIVIEFKPEGKPNYPTKPE